MARTRPQELFQLFLDANFSVGRGTFVRNISVSKIVRSKIKPFVRKLKVQKSWVRKSLVRKMSVRKGICRRRGNLCCFQEPNVQGSNPTSEQTVSNVVFVIQLKLFFSKKRKKNCPRGDRLDDRRFGSHREIWNVFRIKKF
jgi:hypothetical protein